MSISIVLVDGHEIVRVGLRALLEAELDCVIVGEAADGLAAIRVVERSRPDVLVLGLFLPELHGLEVLRIVRQRSSHTRVVVFSIHDTPSYIVAALQGGAAAYVLKGGRACAVITAIREAVAGHRYLSPPLSEQALAHYLQQAESSGIDQHELLTPRERQVLQLAAEGNTCPQIATRLHVSERTIEMHRANLMRKLGLRTQTDLVLHAVRRGMLSVGEPGT